MFRTLGKFFAVFTLVMIFAGFVLGNSAYAAPKPPPPDYFPMAPGYWWTYKNLEKGWEFTIRVVGMEKIGERECYKVETVAANGNVSVVDYYFKDSLPGSVFFVRQEYPNSNMTVNYENLRLYLHNPLVLKDSWSWSGKGMMDVEIEEESQVSAGGVAIDVPAGKFKAGNVETNIKQGGQDVKKSYFFAPNVGLVKSTTETGSMKSTMVLIKYSLKAKK